MQESRTSSNGASSCEEEDTTRAMTREAKILQYFMQYYSFPDVAVCDIDIKSISRYFLGTFKLIIIFNGQF